MDSSDNSSLNDSRHFLLSIEVMVSFIFFIAIMTLIAYCVSLCRTRRLPGVLPHHDTPYEHSFHVESGLNEATLGAFPKLLYSNAKASSKLSSFDGGKYYSSALSCSVCLADYSESDVLRLLPNCGHVFHLKCVDSWLRLHPTCPICRKLPSTPTSPESCKISTRV
ncbi:Putative RING-H2 finger protein ATL71 [Morus notabilis]|uniref:Putative RING-H2 finger protein ATL71 n=1 Tax=Morus notabilis TaxID=981085 RepID=W9S9Y6_9ROSA|nr:RING-H2 finger protein ATL70 [Morus notabilis]EXC32755.1 Putative RING-H2 finger protein ATL71 [Morus notabilis]